MPFKIRLMGHFNLMELKGFYCFKVLMFKVLNGRITKKESGIVMENSINFMDGKIGKEYMKKFTSEIVSRTDVKKVELYFTGGIRDNSFSSAIICGGVSSFVQTVYGYLSHKFDNVSLFSDVSPTFNEDNLELTFDACISISILSIIISAIKAGSKQKKESKNER